MTYSLTDLPNVALLVVVGAVVVGIGATVTSELSSDLSGDAQGAVDNGTEAMANIGKKLPLIGTIVALAIILGVVFSALMFRAR
jgi:hypothetical protein|tara:strand:- start:398 stop:649 length:252 start_codon:yes stop_codon:yes gene_type:complete